MVGTPSRIMTDQQEAACECAVGCCSGDGAEGGGRTSLRRLARLRVGCEAARKGWSVGGGARHTGALCGEAHWSSVWSSGIKAGQRAGGRGLVISHSGLLVCYISLNSFL